MHGRGRQGKAEQWRVRRGKERKAWLGKARHG
jgi:hypothetical protein